MATSPPMGLGFLSVMEELPGDDGHYVGGQLRRS